MDDGLRTGNAVYAQPSPDFDNGADEHDFPDGVFGFRASLRDGPHARWCQCRGASCDSRNRSLSPDPHYRAFIISAVNPEFPYRQRKAILDELNYFANCGMIIPFTLDAAGYHSSAAINGILPLKEKRRVWRTFAELVHQNSNDSAVSCLVPNMPNLGNHELVYDLPEGIFAFSVLNCKGPHPEWCQCGGPSECPPRGLRPPSPSPPASPVQRAVPPQQQRLDRKHGGGPRQVHGRRPAPSTSTTAGPQTRSARRRQRRQRARASQPQTRHYAARPTLPALVPERRRVFHMLARPGTGMTQRLSNSRHQA